MNSSIEVVVVCVTGMVCDAIADALECDSIKVKTRASTIADIDAAQLKDTVVIYIWGAVMTNSRPTRPRSWPIATSNRGSFSAKISTIRSSRT